jgi:hypothetical protein
VYSALLGVYTSLRTSPPYWHPPPPFVRPPDGEGRTHTSQLGLSSYFSVRRWSHRLCSFLLVVWEVIYALYQYENVIVHGRPDGVKGYNSF